MITEDENLQVASPVQITSFNFDRVNKTASFSASLDNGRGHISLSLSVDEAAAKTKDPAKTALKASLEAQVAELNKALDAIA